MSPHVCSKVCRLAELTAAYAAVVRLRLIVHSTPVLLQATLKLEPRWTVRTQICIFIAVHLADVTSQHGRQFEPLSTLGAGEWPFVCVFKDDVPSQQTGPLEANSTLAADVWTEIKVDLLVRVPGTCLSKGFAADTAWIRPLAGM